MRSLICALAIGATAFAAPTKISQHPPHCDDGWFRVGDFCYWYANQKLPFFDAKNDCTTQRNGILFVPDTLEEHEAVFEATPHDTHIWIDQRRTWKEVLRVPSQHNERVRALEIAPFPENLDWLNQPYNSPANRMTSYSLCPAQLRSSATHFSYFYSCDLPFNYICERNMISEPVV